MRFAFALACTAALALGLQDAEAAPEDVHVSLPPLSIQCLKPVFYYLNLDQNLQNAEQVWLHVAI